MKGLSERHFCISVGKRLHGLVCREQKMIRLLMLLRLHGPRSCCYDVLTIQNLPFVVVCDKSNACAKP
jgi:hypothetical protein